MKFNAIVNERLSDKVVNVIMEQIQSGQLKPGDKLPSEPELANALQVSRGILREALTILQARNIIYRKPKEGTFIQSTATEILNDNWNISLKEATYLDLLEVRECLEIRIVEHVIDNITDEQIEELYDLIKAEPSHDQPRSADYYFHYQLAQLSKNVIFASFTNTYYDIIDEITSLTAKSYSRRGSIYDEHKAIVDAIRERDKEAAQKCVIHHLRQVRKNILDKQL